MAKQTGLGDACWIDGIDLSGDIGSLSAIGGGNSPLPVTGIDKSAMERLGGPRDGRIEFTSFFNDATAQAHLTLRTLPTTDRIVTYVRGPALGASAATLTSKQIGYDPTRGDNGSLTIGVSTQANAFGLNWGELYTPGKRTDSGATNGAGVDDGAASAFGFIAYLHVFAFTGSSASVLIQESSDNGGGDPYTTSLGGFGGFSGITGVGANRSNGSGANTVERWLRIATTGTFSNLVFAVAIERHLSSVTY